MAPFLSCTDERAASGKKRATSGAERGEGANLLEVGGLLDEIEDLVGEVGVGEGESLRQRELESDLRRSPNETWEKMFYLGVGSSHFV